MKKSAVSPKAIYRTVRARLNGLPIIFIQTVNERGKTCKKLNYTKGLEIDRSLDAVAKTNPCTHFYGNIQGIPNRWVRF
jgi:hypothetical protein